MNSLLFGNEFDFNSIFHLTIVLSECFQVVSILVSLMYDNLGCVDTMYVESLSIVTFPYLV